MEGVEKEEASAGWWPTRRTRPAAGAPRTAAQQRTPPTPSFECTRASSATSTVEQRVLEVHPERIRPARWTFASSHWSGLRKCSGASPASADKKQLTKVCAQIGRQVPTQANDRRDHHLAQAPRTPE